MVTKSYRVYGIEGHRQKGSFLNSVSYDWSGMCGDRIRLVEFQNSDKTGTNEYTRVIVTRETLEECEEELEGQVSDGYFENYNVGRIVDEGIVEPRSFNVSVICRCSYTASIPIPGNLTREQAIEFIKKELADVPLGELEYIPESDELDEENCDFEEED